MVQIRLEIEEGIDRRDLARIRERFLRLNQVRLQRAMQALSARQQQVLRMLPLLLHVNHPLLPGYVSGTTPCGLSGYVPEPEQVQEARAWARSFNYQRPLGPLPEGSLYSLFLMGSLGSMGHSLYSDMDFWLCHAPDLSESALQALERKCEALRLWAREQGAQMRIFLIDPHSFAKGSKERQLTSDDCGTTQHYLLLDEFYRTSLWLAGRVPLWWFVPDYEEHRYDSYCATLLGKRFVRPEEVVDLGHLAQIPGSEFVSAGMWQIYKGIIEPYKSLLKLLLIELYAAEYPQVDCISLQFKRAIYQSAAQPDQLDAYLLLYKRLEAYLLQRNELERLELVRRCFYLKTGIKLSQPASARHSDWQRELLWQQVRHWAWDERQLRNLDRHKQWKVAEVRSERRLLVSELMDSYRFIGHWARQQGETATANARDLTVLGRRLYAAFERKADKIEHINPQISSDLSEPALTLVEQAATEAGAAGWALYAGHLSRSECQHFTPLHCMPGLLELLAWGWRNRVLSAATSLSLQTLTASLDERSLRELLQLLESNFARADQEVPAEQLLQASRPLCSLLVVNLGCDPLPMLAREDVHIATEQTNPLDFSGRRENLVQRLDRLVLNSWHELMVQSFVGESALADCLAHLASEYRAAAAQDIQVQCFGRVRGHAIAARVREVVQDVMQVRSGTQANAYLLQVREGFQVFFLDADSQDSLHLPDLQALERFLASGMARGLRWQLDVGTLPGQSLREVLQLAQIGSLSLFYRVQGSQAELYIMDEQNLLFRQQVPFYNEAALLLPWQRFFDSMQLRRESTATLLDSHQLRPGLEIDYYRLLPDGRQAVGKAVACQPALVPDVASYLVQAIVGSSGALTLYCGGQEFSAQVHGEQLYAQAAAAILRQRRNRELYPCYLTDLDVSLQPAGTPLSTAQLLEKKATLELALNQALQQLAR